MNMLRAASAVGVLVGASVAGAAPLDVETWTITASDGVELFGESFGTGPDVFFVHGGPSFPPLQKPEWLVELSSVHRIHSIHQRGSGRSERPIGVLPEDEHEATEALLASFSVERHVLDLEEACVARFGQRGVPVIGHSFGAFLASLHAARETGQVSTLVLMAPADVLDGVVEGKPIFAAMEEALPEDERAEFRHRTSIFLGDDGVAGATDAEMALWTDWFGWYFLNACGIEIPRPDSYPPMRWSGGAAVAGLFASLERGGDRTGDLADINVPTLVIYGLDDISPARASVAYAEAIRGARLKPLDGEGHFFTGDPRATADLIAAFIASPAGP